jgi:hypothetical protein
VGARAAARRGGGLGGGGVGVGTRVSPEPPRGVTQKEQLCSRHFISILQVVVVKTSMKCRWSLGGCRAVHLGTQIQSSKSSRSLSSHTKLALPKNLIGSYLEQEL